MGLRASNLTDADQIATAHGPGMGSSSRRGWAPAGITAAAEMVSRLPSGAAEESTGAHQRPTGNSVTAARAASAVVRMPPRNSVTATRAASEAPVVWPLPGMINSVA